MFEFLVSLSSSDYLTSEANELHYTFKRSDHFNVGSSKTHRERMCVTVCKALIAHITIKLSRCFDFSFVCIHLFVHQDEGELLFS